MDPSYEKLVDTDSKRSGVVDCVKSHLPILEWGPKYKLAYLAKDVTIGVTLGLMCLSQTLAQAAIATTLPISGPYCAFIPPIIYALLGTSKHASVSSGSMGCIIIANVLDPNMSIEDRTELATFLALIAGLCQIVMGLLNLAFAVRFLSKATISGFVSGGAVLIMASQMKNLFGYAHAPPKPPYVPGALGKFAGAFMNVEHTNVANFVLCVSLLIVLDICKRLKSHAKGQIKKGDASAKWRVITQVTQMKEIVVITIGILFAYYTMKPDGTPLIPIVGDIPAGLPPFKSPFGETTMALINGPPEKLQSFIVSGCMVAFTSFLTTYASNQKIATLGGYELDASQELFAIGTASAVGSFFGAFLVCGSLSRTALGFQLGASSQVVSFVVAGVIGLSLLFLAPIMYYLPKASLSAIVLTSAKGLIDFQTPKEMWRSSKRTFKQTLQKDFIVWWVGFLFTVLFGALQGIGVSVAVGILQVIAEATAPKAVVLGEVAELGGQLRDTENWADAKTYPGVVVFEFRGPLCFASAEWFHEQLLKRSKDAKVVVLCMEAIPYVDYTALATIKQVLSNFKVHGVQVILAGAIQRVHDAIQEKIDEKYMRCEGKIGRGLSVQEALEMAKEIIKHPEKADAFQDKEKSDAFLRSYRSAHLSEHYHYHLDENADFHAAD
eukprot:TRINITY_DN3923_c0_g4_i1.p1 TRINITY_DN3923_c0_g4~~TRINITY_DN3923_c0_g4_i1.p1  ORF type:complete len:666 (-),score=87.82 TRINITY_DN3923_c0_g4_i1:63-2060(-)